MSFSFRSLFQRGSSTDGTDTAEASSLYSTVIEPAPEVIAAMPSPHPNPFAPSAGSPQPMPFGGPLFKTVANESLNGAPVGAEHQRSPFASAASGPVLTVGDILPQLPPELAKASSLAPDHPISISPQVLNSVLSAGHAALPLFEIYRVCPAIFQMPVSPDDSRMVPLPAAKLPTMLAMAGAPAASPMPQPAQSPFAVLPAGAPPAVAPGASPFASVMDSMNAGRAAATSLPPRRPPGVPPALSTAPEMIPPLDLGGVGSIQPPASPFTAMPTPPPLPQGQPQPPYFSLPTAAPTMPQAETDRAQAPTIGSLLSRETSASPAGGSSAPTPFTVFSSNPPLQPAPEPRRLDADPVQSHASGAVPTPPGPPPQPFAFSAVTPAAHPQPAPSAFVPPQPAQPMASPSFGAPPAQNSATIPTGGGAGPVKIPLVSVLRSLEASQLGFEPSMVPSWILTSVPASVVADVRSGSADSIEVGMLVEGITDVGFRNVLSGANKQFRVPVVPADFEDGGAPIATARAEPAAASIQMPQVPAFQVQSPGPTPIVPQTQAAPFVPTADPVQEKQPPGIIPPISSSTAAFASLLAGSGAPTFEASPPSTPAAVVQPAPGARFDMPFGGPAAATSPPATPSPSAFQFPAQPAATPAPEPSAFKFPAAPAAASVPEPTAFKFPAAPATASVPEPTAFKFPAAPAAASVPEPSPMKQAEPPSGVPPLNAFFAGAVEPNPSSPPPQTKVAGFDPFGTTANSGWGAAPASPPQFGQPDATPAKEGLSSSELFGALAPTNANLEGDEPFAAISMPSLPEIPIRSETVKSGPVVVDAEEVTSAKSAFFSVPTTEKPAAGAQAPAPPSSPPPAAVPSASAFAQEIPHMTSTAPELAGSPGWSRAAPTPQRQQAAAPGLGLSAADTSNEEQLLLRALLATDEALTPQRVVELTAALPGVAACAFIHQDKVIGHSSGKSGEARQFAAQAAELARSLKALAPLIGIDGAETFTLNTDNRLITFCFPSQGALGVLHDREPTLGLRDKLTLLARQMGRMIA
jgi:hypothetical protein